MSLLVVAIHSKAFYGDWCTILRPITDIAVPSFFVLSSYFYFSKLIHNGLNIELLWHFLGRISKLYLFWFVINIPIIILEKKYFVEGGIHDTSRLLLDIIFRYTYYGSWFFSSLAFAILLISFVLYTRFIKYLLLTFSFLLMFYTHCIDLIPVEYHILYDWWATNVRSEVNLTIFESLPWCTLGYFFACLISKYSVLSTRKSFKFYCIGTIMALVCVVQNTVDNNSIAMIISRLVCVILMFLSFGSMQIPNGHVYTHLRKLSTLIFMIHFIVLYSIVILTGHFFNESLQNMIGYIPTYLFVLVITYILSELLIICSNYKYFYILKQSY